MHRWTLAMVGCLSLLLGCGGGGGSSTPAGSTSRWSLTNTPVGTSPVGVLFDGTHIWVANENSNDVYKILAATGAVLQVYPAGHGAQYLAYDPVRGNVWITNPGDGTVTVINASSGAVVTYPAGNSPDGIAFDGTSIWITNQVYTGAPPFPMSTVCTVTQLRASDGSLVATHQVGERPQWVTAGGGYLWVTNGSDNTVSRCTY